MEAGGSDGWRKEEQEIMKRLRLRRTRPNGRLLTTDFEWSLQLQKYWLTEEDLPGLDAEAADLSLRHLDNLPWTTSSHWREGGKE